MPHSYVITFPTDGLVSSDFDLLENIFSTYGLYLENRSGSPGVYIGNIENHISDKDVLVSLCIDLKYDTPYFEFRHLTYYKVEERGDLTPLLRSL